MVKKEADFCDDCGNPILAFKSGIKITGENICFDWVSSKENLREPPLFNCIGEFANHKRMALTICFMCLGKRMPSLNEFLLSSRNKNQ